MRTRRRGRADAALGVCALALAAALAACTPAAVADAPAATVDVWVHSGSGSSVEQATITAQVHNFNLAQRGRVTVRLRVVPEGDYAAVLQAAAANGTLPDAIEVDGPMLASFNFQEALADLTPLLPAGTVQGMLPSLRAQGTVAGRLVGAGVFESGLGMYGNKRLLDAAGVVYPHGLDEGWTAAQFTRALAELAAHDPDHRVLDLKRNYGTGEWLTYGFSPLVWSAGGDLVDRRTGKAAGVLDGPASVRALTELGRWGRVVDPNADDHAFTTGRVALSWVGHWAYPEYAAALKSDLVVLPLPDLGLGTKTGEGSWTWSVGAASAHRAAAGEFVNYLLSAAQVKRMTDANGAVPGRPDVLASSTLYGPGGALERLGRQLADSCGAGAITPACNAVSRPLTPGYPTITASVSAAFAAILDGADPQRSLTAAARSIDADVAANHGYDLNK